MKTIHSILMSIMFILTVSVCNAQTAYEKKVFEEAKASEKQARENERSREESEASRNVKKIKDSQEKTTLGDLSVLSALKDEMINSEKKDDQDSK